MSQCRRNSVRNKVISKKGIYLERNTLHRMWAISKGKSGLPRGFIDLKKCLSEFPGGPVVKTLHLHFRGCGFDSWLGN